MKFSIYILICSLFFLNACVVTKKNRYEKKLTITYFDFSQVSDTLPLHIGTLKPINFLVHNNLNKDVEIIYPYVSNMRARYAKLSNNGYFIKDTICDYFLPEPPPDLDFNVTLLKHGDSLNITVYSYPPICIFGSAGQYELNFLFVYKIRGKSYTAETGWRKLYLKE